MYAPITLSYIINMKIYIMSEYFIMTLHSPEMKFISNMTYLCSKSEKKIQ